MVFELSKNSPCIDEVCRVEAEDLQQRLEAVRLREESEVTREMPCRDAENLRYEEQGGVAQAQPAGAVAQGDRPRPHGGH